MTTHRDLKAGDVLQEGDEWYDTLCKGRYEKVPLAYCGETIPFIPFKTYTCRRPITNVGTVVFDRDYLQSLQDRVPNNKKEIAKLRGMICRYFNHHHHYKDLDIDQLRMIEAIIRPEDNEGVVTKHNSPPIKRCKIEDCCGPVMGGSDLCRDCFSGLTSPQLNY